MPETTALEPLHGVRVLDVSAGVADQVTRILADLGADVLKIEPTGGSPVRAQAPLIDGHSAAYALHNANKRSAILDPSHAHSVRQFHELAAGADILVQDADPRCSAALGLTDSERRDRFEHLVVLSVTDFGLDGPRADWRGNDAVLMALSSMLSRSGPPGGAPLLPPAEIASATAAAQAAWAALVAYYHRLRSGRGQFIDFARYDAVLQALDPPFGAQGQAAAARKLDTVGRGRPGKQDAYPVFRSRDGWVRICLLAPRQWRAMRAWLGEPPQFQDPRYDTISARAADFDRIGAMIAEEFGRHRSAELVEMGAARGVPVAAVLTEFDVVTSEHFRDAGALVTTTLATGEPIVVPDGCMVVDGQRAGIRWLAHPAGADAPAWLTAARPSPVPSTGTRPFDGLTILDLGIIVAGGELGRLFSDLGAHVIKVESPSYPDGLRQTRPGKRMSESFAWTHRNQQSIGLDLRQPAGAEVFTRLVAQADAVFANFKPGTLAGLGFSYPDLAEMNPRLILAESSAYGDRGPWRTRLGYGPLVRAATGVSNLWTADTDAGSDSQNPFSDTVTVFPDHLVARLVATATLAVLIRRHRTGRGGHIHASQSETAVSQLDVVYTTAWAGRRGATITEDRTVHGVYPCQGDDEWCVISIASEDDWTAVTGVLADSRLSDDSRFACLEKRWEHRAELRAALAVHTAAHVAAELAESLQRCGVAAAPMLRASDVLTDPHVRARRLYAEMAHPLIDAVLPTETQSAPYQGIPHAALTPAPILGEHTVEICHELLGMDTEEIDALIADGALHAANPATTQGRTA